MPTRLALLLAAAASPTLADDPAGSWLSYARFDAPNQIGSQIALQYKHKLLQQVYKILLQIDLILDGIAPVTASFGRCACLRTCRVHAMARVPARVPACVPACVPGSLAGIT